MAEPIMVELHLTPTELLALNHHLTGGKLPDLTREGRAALQLAIDKIETLADRIVRARQL
jgi:hypothetical protein